MVANYFSPLAPVVVLLLSAFVLSIVTLRLPSSWQSHWSVRYGLAPGLVLLAGLVLLGSGLSGPVMLSGWHFGTAASGVGLDIGIDTKNLLFLLLTLIILLVVVLFSLPLDTTRGRSWILILGAGAMLLFVSANPLTLAYTVLLFDLLLAYHWLAHKSPNRSIARLFLGIFSTSALILNAKLDGTTLLEIALWLRLGVYPFFEIRASEQQVQNYNFLAYWSLSLAAGLYLVTQTLTTPLPEILRWLIVLTMLLNGILAWLSQAHMKTRPRLLTRLVFTQALLSLLLIPSSLEIIAAFAFGLTLSLAVFWTTPRLGQINVSNLSNFWPYLAPLMATLTLVGLPFLLNWPVWETFYPASFSSNTVAAAVVMLAIILAMSSLVRYWLELWQNENTPDRQTHLIPAIATIIAAIPFLIPGLAPLILSAITQTGFPASSDRILFTLIAIALTTAGAIATGYFRTPIITQLNVSPAVWIKIFDLQWLLIWAEKVLNQIGKAVLRVNVIFEGQHYMGWALFTALVGTLIVILMRSV